MARAVGLTPYRTWLEEFADVPALVIERYDRSASAPQGRLHQEDFNQALGASGDEKYQRFGGKVSLWRIARVLLQYSGQQDVEALFRTVVLAVAIGNLDMHAKKVSMLHFEDGSMALAPAYDIVPQAHQHNDGELALAIAGRYAHSEVTRAHLDEEGRSWGLANTERMIDEVLETVLERVREEDPHPRAHPELAADIERFTQNLLDGHAAGSSLK